jgi:hypothetical protein
MNLKYRHFDRYAALAFVCVVSAAAALGQKPIRFTTDPATDRTWKVTQATFDEGAVSIEGAVRIQNTSSTPVQEARFYAEYFDASGRLCLTLAYAGEVNGNGVDNNANPFAPGEARRLVAHAAALTPATRPVEVSLHLISQRPVGQRTEVAAGDAIVRAPMTGFLPAAGPSGTDDLVLLKLDPSLRSPAVADLALAQVTVGAAGRPSAVKILNTATPAVQPWFEDLLRRAEFFPASTGFVDSPGTGLILLRLINSTEGVAQGPLAPLSSPWLATLADAQLGNELPTVMLWTLYPASKSTRWKNGVLQEPVRDPNALLLTGIGSSWSDAPFQIRYGSTDGARLQQRTWKSAQDFLGDHK